MVFVTRSMKTLITLIRTVKMNDVECYNVKNMRMHPGKQDIFILWCTVIHCSPLLGNKHLLVKWQEQGHWPYIKPQMSTQLCKLLKFCQSKINLWKSRYFMTYIPTITHICFKTWPISIFSTTMQYSMTSIATTIYLFWKWPWYAS